MIHTGEKIYEYVVPSCLQSISIFLDGIKINQTVQVVHNHFMLISVESFCPNGEKWELWKYSFPFQAEWCLTDEAMVVSICMATVRNYC